MANIEINKEPAGVVTFQKDSDAKQTFHGKSFSFYSTGTRVHLSCDGADLSFNAGDNISINGKPFTGTAEKIIDKLSDEVFNWEPDAPQAQPTPAGTGGGSLTVKSQSGDTKWLIGVNDTGALITTKL